MEAFKGPAGIYRPLQGSEIRLVTFKRTSEVTQPVEAQLIHAPLDANPEFFALSYPWGKPGETVPILLDGVEFPVSEQLLYILRRIRSLFRFAFADPPTATDATAYEDAVEKNKDESPIAWWIDAICINQASLAERRQQVARMREIYSAAAEVVIWPGALDAAITPPPEEAHLLLFNDINKYVSAVTELRKEVEESVCDDPPPPDDVCVRALRKNGLDRPLPMKVMARHVVSMQIYYHSRVWTFQEAVLARRGPVVLLDVFPVRLRQFEMLKSAFKALLFASPAHKLALRDLDIFGIEFPLSRVILDAREVIDSLSEPSGSTLAGFAARLSFLLVVSSGTRESSDPQDRVYGLLGMAAPPPSMPPDLAPDYERSFPDVALGYARFLIRHHDRLDLLGMGVGSFADDSCPSWVPDFTTKVHGATSVAELSSPECNDRSVASLSDDGRRLTARGSLVGTAVTVLASAEDMLPYWWDEPGHIDTLLSCWSALLDTIVRPAAALRRVSSELVLGELLENRAGGVSPTSATAGRPALVASLRVAAEQQALHDALQRLGRFFLRCFYVLLDDGLVVWGYEHNGGRPGPGDVVVALRGMGTYAVLRPLQESDGDVESGFRIARPQCFGSGALPERVCGCFFENRAERDFEIW